MKFLQSETVQFFRSKRIGVPLVIAACLIFLDGIYSAKFAYEQFESRAVERVERVTRTVSFLVSPEPFARLIDAFKARNPDLTASPEYQALTQTLRGIHKAQRLGPELRVYFPSSPSLTSMTLLATSNDKPSVGNQLPLPARGAESYRQGKLMRTGIYADREGHWISAFGPIKARGAATVGLVEVHIPLEKEWQKIRSSILQRFLVSSLGVFCLTLLVGLLVAKSSRQQRLASPAAAPVSVPVEKAASVPAANHAREKELEEALRVFRHTFEHEQIYFQSVLQHARDAILFVGPDGRCQAYHSQAAALVFGRSPTDLHLWEMMVCSEERVRDPLDAIFKRGVAFADAVAQLPGEWVAPSGAVYGVQYYSIERDGKPSRVLVRFTALEAEKPSLEKPLQWEESVQRCERYRTELTYRVHECVTTSKRFIAEIGANGLTLLSARALRNALAFAQETCDMFLLTPVEAPLHELYENLSQAEAAPPHIMLAFAPRLKELLTKMLTQWEHVLALYQLGAATDASFARSRVVSEKSLWNFARLLDSKTALADLKQTFHQSLLEAPLVEWLRHCELAARARAQSEHRELAAVEWVMDGVTARNDCLRPLLRVLPDVFVNALAHGIESPLEREEKKKPRAGQIKVSAEIQQFAETNEVWLSLKIRDDGRGVNMATWREEVSRTEPSIRQESDQDCLQRLFEFAGTTNEETNGKFRYTTHGLARVHDAVNRLGGVAEIRSEAGVYFELEILIPLPAEEVRVTTPRTATPPPLKRAA